MAIQTGKTGTTEYLIAGGIAVPHCFTTRLGGVSQGYLESMNIGYHRGDDSQAVEENYRILASALDFDPEKLVLTHQVHSDVVRIVTHRDARGLDHHAYPECDGLITCDPGTALVVFTADCTPVLLWDPVTGAVGAVHAGWRGTAMDIAGKAVSAMCHTFGCAAENIRAAIGPNIGPCCFETDEEVPLALQATYGDAVLPLIHSRQGKFFPDLKQINALALRRAGVTHIDISTECTRCRPDRFWSHRLCGARRGSQGAIIVCREGRRP